MILVDTSAWIEYIRATESPTHRRLRDAVTNRERIATTGMVVLEVLSGARDEQHATQLRGLLARGRYLPVEESSDYEAAAAIYRACRGAGETVRSIADCLVAAVAIRTRATLLHRDADFDAITRVSALQIEEVPGT